MNVNKFLRETGELRAVALSGDFNGTNEDRVIDEAGDVLWYLVHFLPEDIGLPDHYFGACSRDLVREQEDCIDCLQADVASLCESVKKRVFHGKDHRLLIALDAEHALSHLAEALVCCGGLAIAADRSLVKLRKRYPDGFVSGGGKR
jgi:hypothetical protein